LKALKIDPVDQRVYQVEMPLDKSGISALYTEMGWQAFDQLQPWPLELFNHELYVDNHALIAEELLPGFMIRGVNQPLSGYGLVLGWNKTDGLSTDCVLSDAYITKLVSWKSREEISDFANSKL
jgi:hypothetical protein